MWKEITGEDVRSTNIWNSKDPPFNLPVNLRDDRVDFWVRYIRLRENK